jgi:hypothetical protein
MITKISKSKNNNGEKTKPTGDSTEENKIKEEKKIKIS